MRTDPNEPIVFEPVYINAKTDGAVTATVRAYWSPRAGVSFIDCAAWMRGPDPKDQKKTVTLPVLEPRVKFLRDYMTRNQFLRLAIEVEKEWHAAVSRALQPKPVQKAEKAAG
jgi:hypothetical protein